MAKKTIAKSTITITDCFASVKPVMCATDSFSEELEDRKFDVQSKAGAIAEKIEKNTIPSEDLRICVEKDLQRLKDEWPSMFGGEVRKMFVHVDLDSFFASVETLDHPEYNCIPMAVGSNAMLATCNYKAREFGVRAGMPGFIAKATCPALKIVPLHFQMYRYYSDRVMGILREFDSEIEVYGIDEGCMVLDEAKFLKALEAASGGTCITGEEAASAFTPLNLYKLVERIRDRVYMKTGLTVSAGIGLCRGMAKFSSNIKKPNGQFMIVDSVDGHILSLSVNKINGIGKSTQMILEKSMGVATIGDLRSKLDLCSLVFSRKSYLNLMKFSYGFSFHDKYGEEARQPSETKSNGISKTITQTRAMKDLFYYLWMFSEELEKRLRRNGICANTLTVRLKFNDWKTVTKQEKCKFYLFKSVEIFNTAISILDRFYPKNERAEWYIEKPVRQIGLSVSGFCRYDTVPSLERFAPDLGDPEDSHADGKLCIVCKKELNYLSMAAFEMHVNRCIDESKAAAKEMPIKTLDGYFKFSKAKPF